MTGRGRRKPIFFNDDRGIVIWVVDMVILMMIIGRETLMVMF